MANDVTSLVFGDVLLQFGCAVKTTAIAEVEFAERFSGRPTVLFSPHWDKAGRAVGHVETLVRVGSDSFGLASNNGAPNYRVHWLAVGAREGTRAPGPAELTVDDLLMQFGSSGKASGPLLAVTFPRAYRRAPRVHVCPFWSSSSGGVGHTECVESVDPQRALVQSGNAAANYFVNWLAVGSTEDDGRQTFPLDDGVIVETGFLPKNEARVSQSFQTDFARPPVVLVSPFFRQPVGHAETLEEVTTEFFTVLSGNAAADYSVLWIAIGHRE